MTGLKDDQSQQQYQQAMHNQADEDSVSTRLGIPLKSFDPGEKTGLFVFWINGIGEREARPR
jgi:hypothetical protein